MEYYEDPSVNDLISRAKSVFCYGPATGAAISLMYFLSNIITLLISFIVFVSYSTRLIPLVLLMIVVEFSRNYIVLLEVKSREEKEKISRDAKCFLIYLTSYQDLKDRKVLRLEYEFKKRWLELVFREHEIERNIVRKNAFLTFIVNILSALIYLGTLLVIFKLMQNGAFNIAQLAAILNLYNILKDRIQQVSKSAKGLSDFIADAKSGFKFLMLEEKIQSAESIGLDKADIELKNVSYTYPNAKSKTLKKST